MKKYTEKIRNSSTVLFLHGLGATGESWRFQMDALTARGIYPIAPDLPGFGQSAQWVKDWNYSLVIDTLIEILDERGLEKAVLVGISMGGTIALKMVLDHPERFSGVLLANTFARLRPRHISEGIYFFQRGIHALFNNPAAQAEMVARRVFPRDDQFLYRHILVQNINQSNPGVYRKAMRALVAFNVYKRLSEITMPVWVVSGMDDTTIPLVAQRELALGIQGAKHIVIPEAGHAVNVDQPERFNQTLFEFLQQVVGEKV